MIPKQRKFIYLTFLLIIILLIGFVVWSFFKKGTPSKEVITEEPSLTIDFDFLKSKALKQLQLFKHISLPKEKGRENPFEEY